MNTYTLVDDDDKARFFGYYFNGEGLNDQVWLVRLYYSRKIPKKKKKKKCFDVSTALQERAIRNEIVSSYLLLNIIEESVQYNT